MSYGGKRPGAGRPAGSGKFKQQTKPIRVPVSMLDSVLSFIAVNRVGIPIYNSKISAGQLSPADDRSDKCLDLYTHIIKNPDETYGIYIEGDSMIGAGIFPDDLVIVDRKEPAKSGKIVIVALNGQLTCKRLVIKKQKTFLMAENPRYKPIEISDPDSLHIWGVVTKAIRDF
jgi:DNA polymerase V